jgi:hypothetical protein
MNSSGFSRISRISKSAREMPCFSLSSMARRAEARMKFANSCDPRGRPPLFFCFSTLLLNYPFDLTNYCKCSMFNHYAPVLFHVGQRLIRPIPILNARETNNPAIVPTPYAGLHAANSSGLLCSASSRSISASLKEWWASTNSRSEMNVTSLSCKTRYSVPLSKCFG